MNKYTGTVKWWSRIKGLGFIDQASIIPPANEDVFIHYTALEGEGHRNLETGEAVSFDMVANGNKGLMAANVHSLHAGVTASEAYERQGGR